MGDIFLKLLNMSITAGWLILAVLCIRLFFRNIPRWVNCLLWGVVAIRLICPFSIESRFSILPSTEPIKSSTMTDAKTLQKFEKWFRNAEYIYGGTECGKQCACLELTLANGDVVKLSMATDSCPNFHIGGVAYDYRPTLDWNNSEFYKCFNAIPWEFE